MKKIIFFLLMLPFFATAQEALIVQGPSGNLFLNHTAAPKESFYSIGRLYNISPKEIAPYNKLVLENGLTIGQSLKIPLKPVNFAQTNSVEKDEVAVPIYHKVEAAETLFQLSNNYNKVPVTSLKSWNKLKSDAVSPGQNMIIGYLKVKKELSAFAQQATKIPVEIREPVIVKEVTTTIAVPVAETPKTKKEEIVKKKSEPIEETKKVEAEKIKVEPVAKPSNINLSTDLKTGVFKSFFLDSGNEEKGTAGVFKSTSGWEDGKYYCLQNNAAQGAIVKITNPATGKSIYAKVLDVMPDLKQNDNLAIRISNAAADALGAGAANFECKINY